jgi:hypothetical protein
MNEFYLSTIVLCRRVGCVCLLLGVCLSGQRAVYAAPAACSRPISYRIGEIDPQFGLSRTSLRSIAGAAAGIWERGTGSKRFVESKTGIIEIRLKYSQRQDLVEARALLEEQARVVTQSVDSFNSGQSRLNAKIQAFNKDMKKFQQESDALNLDVMRYNNAGKHRPEYAKHLKRQDAFLREWYGRLKKERKQIQSSLAKSNVDRGDVTLQIDGFNQDTSTINQLIARMPDYEKLGEYRASGDTRVITLYVYRDMKQLTALLAHEFGHALGIDHVVVPAALMYPRETEDNTGIQMLHAEDLRAYRGICGGKGPQPRGNYF